VYNGPAQQTSTVVESESTLEGLEHLDPIYGMCRWRPDHNRVGRVPAVPIQIVPLHAAHWVSLSWPINAENRALWNQRVWRKSSFPVMLVGSRRVPGAILRLFPRDAISVSFGFGEKSCSHSYFRRQPVPASSRRKGPSVALAHTHRPSRRVHRPRHSDRSTLAKWDPFPHRGPIPC
jgi:hypothetical protein